MVVDAIGIVGSGRVAQALGRLLRERGEPVTAVASRAPAHAAEAARFIGGVEVVSYENLAERCPRVLIAVSDDALADVAGALARSGMRNGAVLHTCGARGVAAIEELARAGVACGVLHPLQAVSSPQQGVAALPGAAFAISGEGEAAAWARRIVALLNGTPLHVGTGREAVYHAAAVMASNYVVALIDASVQLLRAAGVPEDEALRAIRPLVETNARNALTLTPERALTGPIERGDAETVALHLAALRDAAPGMRQLYCTLGLRVLDLARRRGLDEAYADKLERCLRNG
jgi:predicted short-subunit dehydrogenase-like oxidoreductase (DUF2520 family)